MNVEKSVREIFVDAQSSMQARTKLIVRLKKVSQEIEDDSIFFDVFTNCVKHSLVVFTKEPAVERSIDFIVAFATAEGAAATNYEKKTQDGHLSGGDEDELVSPFLSNFFNFLLDFHDSHSKAVRFRVCQLISKLFDGLNNETSIEESLADRLFDCMLKRLTDKFPAIRVQAVKAIYRLQDSQDPQCPVIESFIHLMERDSSAEVRRAALNSIAVAHWTLGSIINRTQDIKDAVRKAAYEVLAEKVNIKSLKIAQRVKLLKAGLNDRSALVKKACSERLLKAWLMDLGNEIPSLLKRLHVESSQGTPVLALKALFENQTTSSLKKHIEALKMLEQVETESAAILIHPSHLVPEVALYWRVLVEHVKSLENNDDLLDMAIPLASEFCAYVQSFAGSHKLIDNTDSSGEKVQQSEFVMEQLLLLCGCLDFTDEIGRRRVKALTKKLLLDDDVPVTLVESLVTRFSQTESNERQFVQNLVEFISEIKEPMIGEEIPTNAEEARKGETELNELREELGTSRNEENHGKRAAELKEPTEKLETKSQEIKASNQSPNETIRIEKNDPLTIFKCLKIACEMLQKVKTRILTPTIKSLADTLIWPSVQDADLLIRNAAIKCVGLISLLNEEFATKNFVLFLQAAQIDVELVQITATQVIFDLLLMYGFEAFEIDQEMAAPMKNKSKTLEKTGDEADDDASNGDEADDDVSKVAKEMSEDHHGRYMDISLCGSDGASALSIILNALLMLLDGKSPELRFVVAEGICKLLLSGRIRSAKLYTRLVLLWYNPAVSDDLKLRQCLGVFLPNFALATRENQELVEESFLPILRTLFDAPETSPLAEIDQLSVVELMIQLTSLRNRLNRLKSRENVPPSDQDSNSHDSMAVLIANEILSGSKDVVKVLCKSLPKLEISAGNDILVKDLSILCDRILKGIDDKFSKKCIQKFQTSLGYAQKEDSPCNGENTAVSEKAVLNEEEADKASSSIKTVEKSKVPDLLSSGSRSKTLSKAKTSKNTLEKIRSKKTRKTEMENESDSSEEDKDFKQSRRIQSLQASKSVAMEKMKLNLESVLQNDEAENISGDFSSSEEDEG